MTWRPRMTPQEARDYGLVVTACCIGVGAVLVVVWLVGVSCRHQFNC